jgi:hypothetical protein
MDKISAVIPKWGESSEIRSTIPWLSALRHFQGTGTRRKIPSEVQQSCWVQSLKIWVWGRNGLSLWVREPDRRRLLSKRALPKEIWVTDLPMTKLPALCRVSLLTGSKRWVAAKAHTGLGVIQVLTSQRKESQLILRTIARAPGGHDLTVSLN